MKEYGYTKEEVRLFRKLNSPAKIQNYLNTLRFNFEEGGDTCMSPREVVRHKKANCLEGAMLAFAILEFHGFVPRLMDLRSTKKPYDDDHIVTVFRQFGYYGAISKTNHGVLRYREPIYKNPRELAISFFHEYFLSNGTKTLRDYSRLFNLTHFDHLNWRTSSKNLLNISFFLDDIKHYPLLSKQQIKNLRKADRIEIQAGKLVEFRKK